MSNDKYHNGPSVDCYGLPGNAKLNYKHGFCYESSAPATRIDKNVVEQRWHAVQHTFGIDFSDSDAGGVVVKADNSGNCYLGAFDPNCIGTNEKWKIHVNNSFGTNQHEDPITNKYNLGYQTHGTGPGNTSIPVEFNKGVLESIHEKPMTWNLWNIIRQYVFINEFKNKNRSLSDKASWDELEKNTEKLVRSIYRTFKNNQFENNHRRRFDSVTSYGDICLVNWTNSFVEISSLFERNLREHESSFVLFTGNNTYDYNAIRQSKDNFRINTLDGVDSDLDGIDDSFNGIKNDELPLTYTIGEDETYNQIQEQIDIEFDKQISLNDEYPFAENQYENPYLKWDRTVSSATIVNQIIPVYTNMETMTKPYRQITVDELKSITFQVVPQFYWKYEHAYNQFMVHPVGKLNPNSLGMYDMLGNVWEWVRDDWSSSISSFNGYNPIIGSNSNTSTMKVIRGGAFDQFCRKTISSSREQLNINKCSTDSNPNVGFRPAMTYTHESIGDSSDEPLDVFFLFDASGSQTNQSPEMIESANNILEQLGKTNNNMKVGTALFLGPTIRFMCSNTTSKSSTYLYKTYDSVTKIQSQSLISKAQSDEQIRKMEQDGLGFSDINDVWNELKQKFNEFKSSYYSYDVSNEDKSKVRLMTSRGDDDTGITIYPNSNSGWNVGYGIYHPETINRYLDIHTGVDYFDENGNVSEVVQKTFYNFDLNDKENFQWPFLKSSFGVLSNWWAGCEPVTFILSKLLGSGYFDGEPYARLQGYVFRKNSRKLIFVYTNEYDNSMWRSWDGTNVKQSEIVVIPGNTKSDKRIDLFALKMKYTDLFGTQLDDMNPPDPYCFQLMRGSGALGKILDYIKKIGVSIDSIDSISEQWGMFKDLGILGYDASYEGMRSFTTNCNMVKSVDKTCDIQFRDPDSVFQHVNSYQKIVQNFLVKEQVDLFNNENKSNLTINGITFNGSNKYKYVSYDNLNTVGFYELRDVLSRKTDKINVYLMVSDANAPILNHDEDTGIHLFQDYRMFVDILNNKLPNDIYPIVESYVSKITNLDLKKALGTYDESSRTTYFTWKTLYLTNILYHYVTDANRVDVSKVSYSGALCVDSIFDGLDNPYNSNKMILAIRRSKHDSVAQNCTHAIVFPLWKVIQTSQAKDAYENPTKYNAKVKTIDEWRSEKGKDVDISEANVMLVKVDENKITSTRDLSISEFISSRSIQWKSEQFSESETRYVFSEDMFEDYRYVTIKHAGGGVTKLICLMHTKVGSSSAGIRPADDKRINTSTSYLWSSVIDVISNTKSKEYPELFKLCRIAIENQYARYASGIQGHHSTISKYKDSVIGLWTDETIITFVKKFYDNLKKSIPVLMGYRYYSQIFSKMTNGFGKSIVDYEDKTNTIIFKTLPIMNFQNAQNVFDESYNGGQFNIGETNFSYQNCIIDLNPKNTDSELNELKFDGWGRYFPLRFVDDVSNVDDYKTDKILLTRIDDISAKNTKTSYMGSSSDYYDAIDDKYKVEMKDDQSISTASENANVQVTLMNGGSYQKNNEFYDTILDPNDTTVYPAGTPLEQKKKKYSKNKYLFVDPFELTISQWCHAHDKHTKDIAKKYLGEKYSEIETSYWRYMFAFEQDKFKEKYGLNYNGDTIDLINHDADYYIGLMVDSHKYDPLEDTRPYYYATYSDVRGTTQVYKKATGKNGNNYVINPSNGDEYQMNERTSTTSFIDILNNKVVYKTIPREYHTDDVDGGDVLNNDAIKQYINNNKNNSSKKDGEFVHGKQAGLNFDLPTEAQWEYCCRAGSTTAIPPSSNLGQTFEESNSDLDLVAWYKYKVVGISPEPERFCAWRITRFLFGITRDLTQMNNVYEPIDWSR